MEPTLRPGMYIHINKAAYGIRFEGGYLFRWSHPKRGDLVVFRNPDDNVTVVKRCLGIEGDRIDVVSDTLRIGDGSLPLDGRQKEFLSGYASVPPGTLFAAGDSAGNSVDSRDYGFIRVEDIVGKVILYSGKAGVALGHRGRTGVGTVAGDDGK